MPVEFGQADDGFHHHARKPVDSKQFVKAARQLGLNWLVLNEVAYRRE